MSSLGTYRQSFVVKFTREEETKYWTAFVAKGPVVREPDPGTVKSEIEERSGNVSVVVPKSMPMGEPVYPKLWRDLVERAFVIAEEQLFRKYSDAEVLRPTTFVVNVDYEAGEPRRIWESEFNAILAAKDAANGWETFIDWEETEHSGHIIDVIAVEDRYEVTYRGPGGKRTAIIFVEPNPAS